MQGLESPRSEEFELEARHTGTEDQRDASNGNHRQSSVHDSGKSTTSPSLRTDVHLTPRNPQQSAAEKDARRILLRKHVPLVVLPDFDQKTGESGSIQGGEEHRNTGPREGDGENLDEGNEGRGGLEDEGSHRSPSPWVATFFDVGLPAQVIPFKCSFR